MTNTFQNRVVSDSVLFYTVSSRQGTTVLIFLWSRRHSPRPGLHGDKPLSASALPSAFASLTLGPLLSLCETFSPQSHPHWACDLIRPKPQGSAGQRGGGGRRWGQFEQREIRIVSPKFTQETGLTCIKNVFVVKNVSVFRTTCRSTGTVAQTAQNHWFSERWLVRLALSWHSRHCRVLLNCLDPRPGPEEGLEFSSST